MIAPSDTYLAADGQWIALAPTGEAFWRKLCETLGRSPLAEDPRFHDAAARIANIAELTAELGALVAQRPSAEWLELFTAARVPAAVVRGVDDALRHPLTQARHMVEQVPRPGTDEPVSMLGNPFKYGGASVLNYPPAFAADTAEVLERVAGYTPEQVAALAQAGAIGLAAQEARA
jgi:crotonobetainyl-CoA:carnitine CoA-transferase CaiB-like acyl-CoA transferase